MESEEILLYKIVLLLRIEIFKEKWKRRKEGEWMIIYEKSKSIVFGFLYQKCWDIWWDIRKGGEKVWRKEILRNGAHLWVHYLSNWIDLRTIKRFCGNFFPSSGSWFEICLEKNVELETREILLKRKNRIFFEISLLELLLDRFVVSSLELFKGMKRNEGKKT